MADLGATTDRPLLEHAMQKRTPASGYRDRTNHPAITVKKVFLHRAVQAHIVDVWNQLGKAGHGHSSLRKKNALHKILILLFRGAAAGVHEWPDIICRNVTQPIGAIGRCLKDR